MAHSQGSRRRLVSAYAGVAVAAVAAAIVAAPVAAAAGTVCNVDAFAAHQVAVRRGYIFRCVSPDMASATFTYVRGGGLICGGKAMPAAKPSLKGGWNLGSLEVDGGEFQTSQGNGIALVAFRFDVRPGRSTTRTVRTLKLFSVGNGLDCSQAIDQAF